MERHDFHWPQSTHLFFVDSPPPLLTNTTLSILRQTFVMLQGLTNPVADALSHNAVCTHNLSSVAKVGDPQLQSSLTTYVYVPPSMYIQHHLWHKQCNTSSVPSSLRRTVFHSLSHPGVQATPIDTVGPLPPSHGQVYILTRIDRFTCWPEALLHIYLWLDCSLWSAVDYNNRQWKKVWIPTLSSSSLDVNTCELQHTIQWPMASLNDFITNGRQHWGHICHPLNKDLLKV